jgi:hypothetical protein
MGPRLTEAHGDDGEPQGNRAHVDRPRAGMGWGASVLGRRTESAAQPTVVDVAAGHEEGQRRHGGKITYTFSIV